MYVFLTFPPAFTSLASFGFITKTCSLRVWRMLATTQCTPYDEIAFSACHHHRVIVSMLLRKRTRYETHMLEAFTVGGFSEMSPIALGQMLNR